MNVLIVRTRAFAASILTGRLLEKEIFVVDDLLGMACGFFKIILSRDDFCFREYEHVNFVDKVFQLCRLGRRRTRHEF